jgi:GxxExxY protein
MSKGRFRSHSNTKGKSLGVSYRLDLVVNDLVVVEIKAVDRLIAIHEAQLLTYLRLTDKRLGLLMNFHVNAMRDGVKRIVNNL